MPEPFHHHAIFSQVHRRPKARKINRARASFLDLPGELRNAVYGYLLLSAPASNPYVADPVPHAICLVLGRDCCWFYEHASDREENRALTQNLAALCLVGRHIRSEVRSFFFGQNNFFLFSKGAGCVLNFLWFLRTIGNEAKANLKSLTLQRHLRYYQSCPTSTYDDLFRSLEFCTRIRQLHLSVQLEYFLLVPRDRFSDADPDYKPAVEALIYGVGNAPRFTMGGLASTVRQLAQQGELELVDLECRYEMRKSTAARYATERLPEWTTDVKDFLEKELRCALPNGEAEVKIEEGPALD